MIIDVSYANGVIDWKKVKESGVDTAIIRVGYRGYRNGVLCEDRRFRYNARETANAEIKRHFYFMSQAINEEEAREEGEYCAAILTPYIKEKEKKNTVIFIDSEYSNKNHNGRADDLSMRMRTRVIKAFCLAVHSRGYKSGVYASKSWLISEVEHTILDRMVDCIDFIWCAQYNNKLTLGYTVDLWQYTSNGRIDGINGYVDCNRLTSGSKMKTLSAVKMKNNNVFYWVTIGDVATEAEAREHAEKVKKLYPQLVVGIRKGSIDTVEVIE